MTSKEFFVKVSLSKLPKDVAVYKCPDCGTMSLFGGRCSGDTVTGESDCLACGRRFLIPDSTKRIDDLIDKVSRSSLVRVNGSVFDSNVGIDGDIHLTKLSGDYEDDKLLITRLMLEWSTLESGVVIVMDDLRMVILGEVVLT